MKMIDSNRILFRYLFVAIAIVIVLVSLGVSHSLVKKLSDEERTKIEIWAEATKEMATDTVNMNMNLMLRILTSNKTIPVIHYDKLNDFYTSANIDLPSSGDQEFLRKKAQKYSKKHDPIIIKIDDFHQYVYYDDSYTLKKLLVYPYIQLGVLFIFITTAFFALFTTMRMEQNKLWVGLSKETAHQLGTPISSLLAWIEYLKLKETNPSVVLDMEKDVYRLQMITDRFSKIGASPTLEKKDIIEVTKQTINYLEKRISKKVEFQIQFPDSPLYAEVSEPLLSWVIENLTKNAVDAMNGKGQITFLILDQGKHIEINIIDTGKGLAKSKFKTIFHPGYTTKSRGWGLGLSLAKRIIESYHGGKIYVKSSEIDVGTTFSIELKKVN